MSGVVHLHCARPDQDRLAKEGGHIFVHQRVGFDEVQRQVGQRSGVVVAGAGPWIRNL